MSGYGKRVRVAPGSCCACVEGRYGNSWTYRLNIVRIRDVLTNRNVHICMLIVDTIIRNRQQRIGCIRAVKLIGNTRLGLGNAPLHCYICIWTVARTDYRGNIRGIRRTRGCYDLRSIGYAALRTCQADSFDAISIRGIGWECFGFLPVRLRNADFVKEKCFLTVIIVILAVAIIYRPAGDIDLIDSVCHNSRCTIEFPYCRRYGINCLWGGRFSIHIRHGTFICLALEKNGNCRIFIHHTP